VLTFVEMVVAGRARNSAIISKTVVLARVPTANGICSELVQFAVNDTAVDPAVSQTGVADCIGVSVCYVPISGPIYSGDLLMAFVSGYSTTAFTPELPSDTAGVTSWYEYENETWTSGSNHFADFLFYGKAAFTYLTFPADDNITIPFSATVTHADPIVMDVAGTNLTLSSGEKAYCNASCSTTIQTNSTSVPTDSIALANTYVDSGGYASVGSGWASVTTSVNYILGEYNQAPGTSTNFPFSSFFAPASWGDLGVVVAGGTSSYPTVSQTAYKDCTSTSTCIISSLSNWIATGDLLLVFAPGYSSSSGFQATSVSGGLGATFVKLDGSNFGISSTYYSDSVFAGITTSSGSSDTITVTYNHSATRTDPLVMDVTGPQVDVYAYNTADCTSSCSSALKVGTNSSVAGNYVIASDGIADGGTELLWSDGFTPIHTASSYMSGEWARNEGNPYDWTSTNYQIDSLTAPTAWGLVGAVVMGPEVIQPITATRTGPGSSQSPIAVSGCNVNPTTLNGDGTAHDFAASPSCSLNLQMPSSAIPYYTWENTGLGTTTVATCAGPAICSGDTPHYVEFAPINNPSNAKTYQKFNFTSFPASVTVRTFNSSAYDLYAGSCSTFPCEADNSSGSENSLSYQFNLYTPSFEVNNKTDTSPYYYCGNGSNTTDDCRAFAMQAVITFHGGDNTCTAKPQGAPGSPPAFNVTAYPFKCSDITGPGDSFEWVVDSSADNFTDAKLEINGTLVDTWPGDKIFNVTGSHFFNMTDAWAQSLFAGPDTGASFGNLYSGGGTMSYVGMQGAACSSSCGIYNHGTGEYSNVAETNATTGGSTLNQTSSAALSLPAVNQVPQAEEERRTRRT
jgi:hypothetical protein